MEFWLRIALASLSAPHQRCQHRVKGALLLTEDPEGLTTLLALILIGNGDALLTTSVPLAGPISSIVQALQL